MNKLLTTDQFLWLSGAVLLGLILLSSYKRRSATREGFWLNDRATSIVLGAVGCYAAWAWAPAYFISSQFGYLYGWLGPLWYIPINAACLALFAFAPLKLARLNPRGYTLPEYMQRRYSGRVELLYEITFAALGISAFAVQVLAGAGAIAYLTPIPYTYATIGLALAPILYTIPGGLRASILSDNAKGWVLIIALVIVLIGVFTTTDGFATLAAGMFGKSGEYVHPFEGAGPIMLMLTFGIPSSLNWLAGPWRDQTFWQLGYSGNRQARAKQFLFAAPLFALVVFGLSLIGIFAAGVVRTMPISIANEQYVNIDLVRQLLPWPIAVFFAGVLILGLMSTLDSHVVSVGTLAGNDLFRRLWPTDASDERQIRFSRIAMFVVPVLGIAIANIPDLKIIHLFLIYGSLGAATFLPTVLTLIMNDTSERGMFWGIIVSLSIGWPLAITGYLLSNSPEWFIPVIEWGRAVAGTQTVANLKIFLPPIGAAITMFASGFIVFVSSIKRRSVPVTA